MNTLIAQANAILFDLDGTLVDSVPDLAKAVDQMLLALDRPPAGSEKVRCWVGNGAPALVKRALADDAHGDETGRVADDLYQQAYPLFAKAYADCAVHATGVYPFVEDLLRAVSDKPTALITNKPRKFTLMILDSLNLTQWFDVVVCGDDYAEKKPNPMPLNKALEQLNIKARDAVMIGDSVSDIKACDAVMIGDSVSDIKACDAVMIGDSISDIKACDAVMIGDSISDINAAQAAGCSSIAVTYGYNHGQCASQLGADVTVNSLAELLS